MQEFVYVSAVKGHLVNRFPSLRQPTAQYIGAARKGKKITWDEDQVVAIPEQEWRKYRREYRRAVADGALKERSKADFDAWQAKRKASDEEDRAKAEKAKHEASEAEAKAKRGEPPVVASEPAAPAGDKQPANPTATKGSGKARA